MKTDAKLWFGLMPPGGTGNIFLEMFVRRNQAVNFVEPCPLACHSESYPGWTYTERTVPYVEKIESLFGTGFRTVPWDQHTQTIQDSLTAHSPQQMWFATFDTDTFENVKQKLSDAFTVSINYQESDYDFVVSKWVRWQTGLIMSNENYGHWRERFDNNHWDISNYLSEHGAREFGYSIPKSRHASADLEINIKDLYSKEAIKNIATATGSINSAEDWKFYDLFCRTVR